MRAHAARAGALVALCAFASLVAVSAAQANHQFSDVPSEHPFHPEIGIFKDTNITSGCTATDFCPQDFVRRQAMAAFIDRALGLLVRPGESTQKGIPGSRVEMLDDDLSFVGTTANALRLRGPDNNIVGGSPENSVATDVVGATIAGGGPASGTSSPNSVRADWGTVGGGRGNTAGDPTGPIGWGSGATVSGGLGNTANGEAAATVGGGVTNLAEGTYSTIGGGRENTIPFGGNRATIGGGFSNVASNDSATVAGGWDNTASNNGATVGGGVGNVASGARATVAGGYLSAATGDYSFAAGVRAKANHVGSIVFSDSQDADFASTANNQFNVRAFNGIRLFGNVGVGGNGNAYAGRTSVTVHGPVIAGGDNASACDLYIADDVCLRDFQNGKLSVRNVFDTGWTAVQASAFEAQSSIALKKDVARVAPRGADAMLRLLERLDLYRYRYRNEAASRVAHTGVIAERSPAQILSDDGKALSVSDFAGVTAGATKALAARVAALQRENGKLRRAVAELQRQNARVDALEQQVANLAARD